MSSLTTFHFKKINFNSSLLATCFALVLSSFSLNAWALFSDEDARKAIVDLRKTVAGSQSVILDLQSQVDKLKSENAQLRGQIEGLQKQADELSANQKAYYRDLDKRVGVFEPQTIQVEGVSGLVQPGEKAAYDEALASFQASNLKKANTELSSFINKYPSSPYLPLALYWSGNTKYALKDYPGAITQLQTLMNKYPDHPRIPAATLSLANAQLESGKKTLAKKLLTDLMAKYPDSDSAKEAKKIAASLN